MSVKRANALTVLPSSLTSLENLAWRCVWRSSKVALRRLSCSSVSVTALAMRDDHLKASHLRADASSLSA